MGGDSIWRRRNVFIWQFIEHIYINIVYRFYFLSIVADDYNIFTVSFPQYTHLENGHPYWLARMDRSIDVPRHVYLHGHVALFTRRKCREHVSGCVDLCGF